MLSTCYIIRTRKRHRLIVLDVSPYPEYFTVDVVRYIYIEHVHVYIVYRKHRHIVFLFLLIFKHDGVYSNQMNLGFIFELDIFHRSSTA